MLKYSHIVWDWNGTLLNDVEWCIKSVNTMLKKRDLDIIPDIKAYHDIFCFPVIKYYEKAGFDFDKEDFNALAEEYIGLYHDKNSTCQLHINAESVLSELKSMGLRQIILSASHIDLLVEQISPFGIADYFDTILGISDILASSKVQAGIDYFNRIKPEKALLIGDTVHDYEVAKALGADCALIANGHQSRETLLSCGVTVLNDILDVINLI